MGVLAWMRVERGHMELSPVTESIDTSLINLLLSTDDARYISW